LITVSAALADRRNTGRPPTDALENVITIKKLRKGHEQVITVVGCGGDRR